MGILPKWIHELSWADFWGGVKEDISKGARTIGEATKSVLEGATKVLTPTVIWLVVVIVIGLLFYTWLRKAIKA